MSRFSTSEMACLLLAWGVFLFLLAWFLARRRDETAEGFTVAGRQIGFGFGAASLLAGWIWALSLYAPAQAGYQYGVAGPFYYSLGGAMMLCVFVPFVRRIRALTPEGHTIPEYVGARLGIQARVLTMIITLLWCPIILFFNLSVVGYLVSNFSSLSFQAGVLIVAVTVTSYSLAAGLKASIITDCVQFAAISIAGLLIVPIVFARSGGVEAMSAGLATLGDKGNFLSAKAFFQMGLPWLVLGLLGGFSYQSVWQRAWAIRVKDLGRSYFLAGAGWFPYSLAFGIFGIIALTAGIPSPAGDGSDITPAVAAHYLHSIEAVIFVVLVLAAACSTCDSALCAFSTILMTDVAKGFLHKDASEKHLLIWGRAGMIVAAALGAALTMYKVSLLQFIFILGAARAPLVFPLLGSLFWNRIEGRGYFWGVLGGICAGVASALWLRSITSYHNLFSILISIGVSASFCLYFAWRNPHQFDYSRLKESVRRFAYERR
ncbi:MAG: hypothetical protein IT210_06370 [Armatimonadetes bacterium]|nr:hypothetical protein [Armatimonadota bacterium]